MSAMEFKQRIRQLLIDAWRDGHDNTKPEKGCIDYDADLECFFENKEAEINALCEGNTNTSTGSKCNKHIVNNSALPSLPEFAVDNFDSVVKLAQRLTTGNVSHQAMTIEGLAKRNSEFIRKHYC